MQELVERVADLREARDWSEAELARRAGLDQTALNRLMRGRLRWRIDQIVAIAEALGVSPGSLLDGEDTGLSDVEQAVILALRTRGPIAAARLCLEFAEPPSSP